MLVSEKNISSIIESKLDQMTKLEKEIATYFTNLDPSSADLSLESTVTHLHISPSALTRFAKKCGFSGYREFVFAFQNNQEYVNKHFERVQNNLTKKVLLDYEQIIQSTNSLIDEQKLEDVAKMIDKSKRVYFYGIGSSGLVAMEIKSRFMRLGVVCDAITDKNNIIWTTNILDSHCLVIGLSLSGQTKEVMEHLAIASEKGVPTVLLTTKPSQPLPLQQVIPVASVHQINHGNRISPQIPLLIMLDIIYSYFQSIDKERKETIFKQSLRE
ncbi:TPA: MurR/RpiR family transcriptional regulator [Streptococcus suis]